MKKKSVFLVDDSKNYVDELNKELVNEEVNVVGYSLNGEDALRKIKLFEDIDILVINSKLPIKDGFDVLKEIKTNQSIYPDIEFIILQVDVINERVINLIQSLKIDQVIFKEESNKRIIEQIRNVEETKELSEKDEVNKRITKILHNVGIPAHIKGYNFIRHAVEMVIENPSVIGQVTKCLYPSIAIKFQSSPSKVERAIRHAIELGWSRGDQDTIDEIFGYTISAAKAKPTNSEFIAMVADYITLNEDKKNYQMSNFRHKMSY